MSKSAAKPRTLSKISKAQSVAEFLTQMIALCGESQKEIADAAGFPRPNVISMLKNGTTKVPLERIGTLAKALHVDPIHLFKMCMNEYMPETWAEIQKMFNQPILTENELTILETIRTANVTNPVVRTEEEKLRLLDVINTLKGDNEVGASV